MDVLFVQLNKNEKMMLKELLKRYGFHFESEFIRYLIRELYTKGKLELIPFDTKPLGY